VNWIIDFVKENWPLLISIILGPLGIIIALVIKHWDDIMAAFSKAWNWIRDTAVSVWEGIKNAIVDPIVTAAQWVGDKISAIVGFFADIPRRIGEGLSSLGRIIGDGFKGALNIGIEIINWFVRRANDIIDGLNWINPFGNPIPKLRELAKLHQGGIVPGPK